METQEKKSGESNLSAKNEKRSKSSSDTPPTRAFGEKEVGELSSKFELPSLKIDQKFLDEHD